MDIVHYCIQHMSSKEHIHFLFNEFGIEHKMSDSYEKLVFRLLQSKNKKLDLVIIEKIGNQHPSNFILQI